MEVFRVRTVEGAEAYLEYMTANGYRPFDDEAELENEAGTDWRRYAAFHLGERRAADASIAQAFAELLRQQSPALLHVPTSGEGIGVMFFRSHRLSYGERSHTGGIGEAAWYAGESDRAGTWLRGDATWTDLVDRDGEVLMCEVVMVVSFEGCDRPHVLQLRSVFDPEADAWWFVLAFERNKDCDDRRELLF